MDENNNLMVAEEGAAADAAEKAEYARLAEENRVLSAELASLRTDLQRRAEQEQGEKLLERLVGSRTDPLFEMALARAKEEDLAPLSAEKRFELGYLICLGKQAREGRPAPGRTAGYPPAFAPSAGGGQVALSTLKAPTSFEMAKENAKKYFRH